MARNEITVNVPAARVWSVLADGRAYGHWVVGSSEIRDIEPGFPAEGSRFHHRVGWGPFKVADHTLVEQSEPPHRLHLRAKARPMGTAKVRLELHADGAERTRVVMEETAGDKLSALVLNPLTDFLVRARNRESLRRLREMAEGRGPSHAEAARP